MTSRGALTPEQQLKVLARVWDRPEEADGWVFLPWIPGTCRTKEDRRRNWNEGRAYKWPQDRDAVLAHLEMHQKDDLYFTPTTFLGESRIAQLTGEETVLYADLDEVDPTQDIDAELKPTIAWETSPNRFQAVWVLSEFADGATDAGGLNHRLTAFLGADPSGWDCTQLLRVPGKRNYKPDYRDDESGDAPPGRLLWATEKRYTIAFFESILPEVDTYGIGEQIEESEIGNVDRHSVWGRVRLKVSHSVRTYMGMKSRQINPEEHDRSEIMWQIERDLADAGCSVAEIVAIIRPTPWNKLAGRNDEMGQLIREAQKAIAVAAKDSEEDTLEGESASIRSKEPLWLDDRLELPIKRPQWQVNRIWTVGSCGFIAAEPKSYKSYFGLDLLLSIATGSAFLNDPQFMCKQGNVLMLQEEDPDPLVMFRIAQILEQKAPDAFKHGQLSFDTSSPTYNAASASGLISDIFWTPQQRRVPLALEVRKGFVVSSPADQAWLLDFISDNNFKFVLIDTLGTTLGNLGSNEAEQMYPKVLNPLKDISNATGSSICIVHHNRKNGSDSRRGQQMMGTGAFHAWTESALYLSKGEHETRKPAEVKVERESKFDQDFKFRVSIPHMGQEGRYFAEGERQLWDPTVIEGWASDSEETDPKKYVPGQEVTSYVLDKYGAQAWLTVSRIASSWRKNPGTVEKQLDKAVASGLMEFDVDRYRVRADA